MVALLRPEATIKIPGRVAAAAIVPRVIANIFVDAERTMPDRPARKVRNDDRDVTFPRHHGVRSVGVALKRRVGVGVRVSDHGQVFLAAERPESGEGIAVQVESRGEGFPAPARGHGDVGCLAGGGGEGSQAGWTHSILIEPVSDRGRRRSELETEDGFAGGIIGSNRGVQYLD
jgi:hypothetical protein